jgi:hypothetical protein
MNRYVMLLPCLEFVHYPQLFLRKLSACQTFGDGDVLQQAHHTAASCSVQSYLYAI